MDEEIYMGQLLNCLLLDSTVVVLDENGTECWRGPVRRYPWTMLDCQVMEVSARDGLVHVATDSKRDDWR